MFGVIFLRLQIVIWATLMVCSLIACEQKNLTALSGPIKLSIGTGQPTLLGHFEQQPRFSWQLPSDVNSKAQIAYQLQVATDRRIDQADLWDSGKIDRAQTTWIRYEGKPLASRQVVYWRVRYWDETQKVSNWSDVQSFELGLLSNQDWNAQWIGHNQTAENAKPSQATLATAQYVKTEFSVEQSIKKARLYITAKGVFKSYINGKEIAPEDVLTPGWTPYEKRIETLTYDVTTQLVQGHNLLAATIAAGWYGGRVYNFKEREFLKAPRLLAQLEIELADGSIQVVKSDENWQASMSGPVRFASIYGGEHYHQSDFEKKWLLPQQVSDDWSAVIVEPRDEDVLLAPKQHAPVRIREEISPVEILSNVDGKVIFDFGQNMVGVPKITIPVKAGQQVTMRFAEALHKGEFYTDNYRSAASTNYYLPNQSGFITYKPTFTYHGYRYLELSGYDGSFAPEKSWVKALVQHSDVEITASFTSSNPKLNKLASNILWGLRSNFYDIPLDCPQRDERLGWTGDAQVFVTPSMYMADVYGFWSAWLASIREDQGADGKIPLYVPHVTWLDFASSGWGDAATIIPWELYMATGDMAILKDNYEMMKRWVDYHQSQSHNLVSTMQTFGDWLQPFPADDVPGNNKNRGDTDFSLIGTAYFARSVELTLKAAKVLNRAEDVVHLTALHEQLKSTFSAHFFDDELNLKQGRATQTTYLLGLAFELFPEEKKSQAEAHLLALLAQADHHLRTGFLGTPLLAEVLEKAGRSDLVYDLIFNETYPSWFYSINNGATTTWERWNSYSLENGFNPEGMNSLNHYAYGSISRWFYEGILGIKPITPGFSKFSISPQFSGKLTSAKGQVATPHGDIKVSWQRIGQEMQLYVSVPKNTVSQLHLPKLDPTSLKINGTNITDVNSIALKPGRYSIKGRLNSLQ